MKIEIDPRSGFCFGVVRAIDMAERELAAGVRLVSLGDIVHNEEEVRRLEKMGLLTVNEHTDISTLAAGGERVGTRVLIRAHGEPPSTYEAARRAGVTLVDATCPVVSALQKTVARASGEMAAVGGQVVIFGRRGHAEVRGLIGQVCRDRGRDASLPRNNYARSFTDVNSLANFSRALPDDPADDNLVCRDRGRDASLPRNNYARSFTDVNSLANFSRALPDDPDHDNLVCRDRGRDAVIVIERAADLDAVDFARPIYFLAQTTGSLEEFRELAEEIRRRAPATVGAGAQVVVRDTICRQVADREALIGEFAKKHDVVVFVAGVKSSNGRVLFQAVQKANSHSYKVQNGGELRSEWFDGAKSVGVCGATSTPRWLMERVAAALRTPV